MPDIQDLQSQIADLRQQMQNPQVNFDTQLFGLIQTVSVVPTGMPLSLYDQIKIYTNGTTYRLYWYDAPNHIWHYSTGV